MSATTQRSVAVEQLASLEAHRARTDARLEAITKDLESLTSAVGNLAEVVRHRGQTNWGVITSAVGVSFTILAAIFSIVISNQAAVTQRIERQLEASIARSERNAERQSAQLDTILQREMRLLDDNTKSHMREVDARLSQRLNQTMERLRVVESWQRENNTANTANIASLQAAVRDLKDTVKSRGYSSIPAPVRKPD